MRPRTVLSLEQALSLSYATLRFVHLGWRVIRIEPTPQAGRRSRGDPNRYIGRPVAGEDRHSYYVAPNVGKQAIALDLKRPEGQAVLRRLIRELPADVFCTNTLPAHHRGLGIDYETLRREHEGLIWCGISALGLAHPDVPGYDPIIQALCGYMDLTGEAAGPPLLCGPPLADLKAGDEAFTQVILALMQRQETGHGAMIDISMARAAASWLQTSLPMLEMDSPPEEIRRSGNEHRQFIPVNAYATADGYVYLAIGSDVQWQRLVADEMFAALNQPRYALNEGRRAHKAELHQALVGITRQQATAAVEGVLRRAQIPHAHITPIEQVADLEVLTPDLLQTTTPDGRRVRLPPAAVSTEFLARANRELSFAPRYAEHTTQVLGEVGYSKSEIAALQEQGAVA